MKFPILIPNIFNYPFTYESQLNLKIGDFVEVPFGKSKKIGVVWDYFENDNNKNYKTKKIIKKLEIPQLKKKTLDFLNWFSEYNIVPKGMALKLSLLSGFTPPTFYSVYGTEGECPLGLNCYKDFYSGLRHAEKLNKPILIDFTGWACVNCRRMEENVWSKPRVYKILNEEYVLISLYVDDRQKLSDDQMFNFKYFNGKVFSLHYMLLSFHIY